MVRNSSSEHGNSGYSSPARKRILRYFTHPIRNVNELLGRTETRIVTLLNHQSQVAINAIELATSMVDEEIASHEAREQVRGIEAKGDAYRKRLIKLLERSLVTPIDREDIYRFSRYVDDIVDNIRDFIREHDIYQPDSELDIDEALELLNDAILELADAAKLLAEQPVKVIIHTLRSRKFCNETRLSYQHALSKLFDAPITGNTMKNRELVGRLEMVTASVEEACDAINDGLFKRNL